MSLAFCRTKDKPCASHLLLSALGYFLSLPNSQCRHRTRSSYRLTCVSSRRNGLSLQIFPYESLLRSDDSSLCRAQVREAGKDERR